MTEHTPHMRRFWQKVSVNTETGCWEWSASVSRLGYGKFWDGRRVVLAHRFSYEALLGPIPAGLEIDHLCRNRSCVNPSHLEAVTRGENVRRSSLPEVARRMSLSKTHCPRGHAYTGENLYTHPTNGCRKCRTCNRDRSRANRARSKEAA